MNLFERAIKDFLDSCDFLKDLEGLSFLGGPWSYESCKNSWVRIWVIFAFDIFNLKIKIT